MKKKIPWRKVFTSSADVDVFVRGNAKQIHSDASGIFEWRCDYKKCDKRIYSLYKRQLESNVRAHMKTHEYEMTKDAVARAVRLSKRRKN